MSASYYLINSGALTELREWPEDSFDCCVTSPPYWGLRDYKVDGQIGLEPDPDSYVNHLVEVFHEVKRTLSDDGTLWLNIGDSYSPTGGNRNGCGGNGPNSCVGPSADAAMPQNNRVEQRRSLLHSGVKPKDLVGIPWLLAFALRADGWYLRSDIIWHKPNPMPESVTDRPSRAHEYIFLLSKNSHYYYDAAAIKEPISPKTLTVHTTPRKGNGVESTGEKLNLWMERNGGRYHPEKRNKRSVWNVSPSAYKGAHFATFPTQLITPCILAGCPPAGYVLDPFCGSGTTLKVATDLGRNAVGIELNEEYCYLTERRMNPPAARKR